MSDFRRTIMLPDEAEGVTMIGFEDNGALAKWGPCYRSRYILHFVTKGRGYFNGTPVSEGYGFFIRPTEISEYHSDMNEPWNYLWLIFSEELAVRYVIPYLKPDGNGIFRAGYTDELLRLRDTVFSTDATMTTPEALSFFFSVLSLHEKRGAVTEPMPNAHVRHAKLYMEEHYTHKITVRDVAAAIHVNDRYLYNLFVRLEGVTPKAYLDGYRIRTAEVLLKESSLTVTEVARAVGFPDVCVFSRFFSGRTGKSPTQFRRDAGGNKLPAF